MHICQGFELIVRLRACNQQEDRLIFRQLMRNGIQILVIAVCLATAVLSVIAEDTRETAVINLFFTGDVQGSFEPCGCAGGPTGGIARRVGFSREYLDQHGGVGIHVDAGNYLAAPGPDSKKVNDFLISSLTGIPLEVLNLGSDDLYWWKDLSRLELPGVRFISTNLVPRRQNLETPDRWAVVEVSAERLGIEKPIRIAFLGLVDPKLVKPNSGFRARDPLLAVREVKKQVLSEADFIVVLWDMIRPKGDIKDTVIGELAREHPEIYAVITTEKRFVLYDPVQIQSAVILSSVERGRYLGLLRMNVGPSGEVTAVVPRFFEMGDTVAEDTFLAEEQRKISLIRR